MAPPPLGGSPDPHLPPTTPELDERGRGEDVGFVHEVQVRYGETDQMGVAHHGSYLIYLEEARTGLMRAHGTPYGEVERSGIGLPVRNITLKYRAPAFYEDRIQVECWVSALRSASVSFSYEVYRTELDGSRAHLLSAVVELACVDLQTRRPRVMPEGLHGAFAARLR
ncbi:MAG: thioesterase family protein [Planctomycetota bacterium]|jgi:acyl-CoA thioester hydrolase